MPKVNNYSSNSISSRHNSISSKDSTTSSEENDADSIPPAKPLLIRSISKEDISFLEEVSERLRSKVEKQNKSRKTTNPTFGLAAPLVTLLQTWKTKKRDEKIRTLCESLIPKLMNTGESLKDILNSVEDRKENNLSFGLTILNEMEATVSSSMEQIENFDEMLYNCLQIASTLKKEMLNVQSMFTFEEEINSLFDRQLLFPSEEPVANNDDAKLEDPASTSAENLTPCSNATVSRSRDGHHHHHSRHGHHHGGNNHHHNRHNNKPYVVSACGNKTKSSSLRVNATPATWQGFSDQGCCNRSSSKGFKIYTRGDSDVSPDCESEDDPVIIDVPLLHLKSALKSVSLSPQLMNSYLYDSNRGEGVDSDTDSLESSSTTNSFSSSGSGGSCKDKDSHDHSSSSSSSSISNSLTELLFHVARSHHSSGHSSSSFSPLNSSSHGSSRSSSSSSSSSSPPNSPQPSQSSSSIFPKFAMALLHSNNNSNNNNNNSPKPASFPNSPKRGAAAMPSFSSHCQPQEPSSSSCVNNVLLEKTIESCALELLGIQNIHAHIYHLIRKNRSEAEHQSISNHIDSILQVKKEISKNVENIKNARADVKETLKHYRKMRDELKKLCEQADEVGTTGQLSLQNYYHRNKSMSEGDIKLGQGQRDGGSNAFAQTGETTPPTRLSPQVLIHLSQQQQASCEKSFLFRPAGAGDSAAPIDEDDELDAMITFGTENSKVEQTTADMGSGLGCAFPSAERPKLRCSCTLDDETSQSQLQEPLPLPPKPREYVVADVFNKNIFGFGNSCSSFGMTSTSAKSQSDSNSVIIGSRNDSYAGSINGFVGQVNGEHHRVFNLSNEDADLVYQCVHDIKVILKEEKVVKSQLATVEHLLVTTIDAIANVPPMTKVSSSHHHKKPKPR